MLQHRIKKLPIMDPNKSDRVIGILSLTDIALIEPKLIHKFKAIENEEKAVKN